MNDNRSEGLTIKICKTGNKYKYYYAYHDTSDWNEVSERSKLRYDPRLVYLDLDKDSDYLVKCLINDIGLGEEPTTIFIDNTIIFDTISLKRDVLRSGYCDSV